MEEELFKLKKNNNRKNVIIVILVLILVVSGVLVYFFLYDKKDNNSSNQNNQQEEVKKDYPRLEQIDLTELNDKDIEVEFAGKKVVLRRKEDKLYINGEEKTTVPAGVYVTNDVVLFYALGECGYAFYDYLDSDLQVKEIKSYVDANDEDDELQLVNITLQNDGISATTTSCPCGDIACNQQDVKISYKNNIVSIVKS